MKKNSESRMLYISDGNTALDPGYMPKDRYSGCGRPDVAGSHRRKVRVLRSVDTYPNGLFDEREDEEDDPETSDRILRLVGLAGTSESEVRKEYLSDSAEEAEEIVASCEELTVSQLIFAGVMGLLEQICLFFLLGLQVSLVPAVTLVFLWFLFSMITAGIMTEAREFLKKIEKDDRINGDRIYCTGKRKENI